MVIVVSFLESDLLAETVAINIHLSVVDYRRLRVCGEVKPTAKCKIVKAITYGFQNSSKTNSSKPQIRLISLIIRFKLSSRKITLDFETKKCLNPLIEEFQIHLN